jgi:phosphoribosylanthranilate isomerase
LPSLNPTWVKICGVRTVDAALHAESCGADAIGINLHKPSPRFVNPILAQKIQAAISIPAYLVVVNWTPQALAELIAQVNPGGLQFHGDTSDATALQIGHPYLKAFQAGPNCLAQLQASPANRVLLDAYHPTLRGGTGRQVDRELAQAACEFKEVILAGGLNPDNVAEWIRSFSPFGVDVASGVESQPGKQDRAKVKAFIAAAKTAMRNTP